MARDGGPVALRADRVVDIEAGEVRRGRVVLVRGERIEALLERGDPLPQGTEVVDLPGHTLLPGRSTATPTWSARSRGRGSRRSTAAPPRRP